MVPLGVFWSALRGRFAAPRGEVLGQTEPSTVGARPTAFTQASTLLDLGFRTWRPRYMPLLRSMWCGRRSSPESLSSTYVGFLRPSAERRMPRFDGDVLRLGT